MAGTNDICCRLSRVKSDPVRRVPSFVMLYQIDTYQGTYLNERESLQHMSLVPAIDARHHITKMSRYNHQNGGAMTRVGSAVRVRPFSSIFRGNLSFRMCSRLHASKCRGVHQPLFSIRIRAV